MTDKILLGYYAGLFDGEGSVFISKSMNKDGYHRNPTYLLQVSICMTHKKLLEDVRNIFGGWITTKKSTKRTHKTAYLWQLKGDNALNFLRSIYPYLRIKRAQADLAAHFHKNKRIDKRGLSQRELLWREKIRSMIQTLNGVGVK